MRTLRVAAILGCWISFASAAVTRLPVHVRATLERPTSAQMLYSTAQLPSAVKRTWRLGYRGPSLLVRRPWETVQRDRRRVGFQDPRTSFDLGSAGSGLLHHPLRAGRPRPRLFSPCRALHARIACQSSLGSHRRFPEEAAQRLSSVCQRDPFGNT